VRLIFVLMVAGSFFLNGLAAEALAHGVNYRVEAQPTDRPPQEIVVTFSHHEGAALTPGVYKIMPPDSDETFLTGEVNSQGQVTFSPTKPGLWRVRVFTLDGHGATAEVNVGNDLFLSGTRPSGSSFKVLRGVMLGLIALFLLGGLRKRLAQ